jgi:hypothetical protein
MWQKMDSIICDEKDRAHIQELRKEYKNLVRNLWNPFDKSNEKILGCTTVNRLYITPLGDVLVCPYVHIKIGNIIKDKIYINFPKHEWKNCIRMLKIRANSIYNTVYIPKFKAELLGHKIYNCKTDMVAFKLHSESEIVKRVSYWSTHNIERWFRSNKIDMEMLENFYPINGEILVQLYEIRSMAPHFFYKSFKKSKTDNIKDISAFSFCLFKLFSARDYVSYEPFYTQI